MANYRNIHVKIWADPKVEDLNPNSKLLFIYLLTNSYRNESAVYNITPKKLKDETCIKDIKQAMDDLLEKQMIRYDFDKNVVWVVNAIKYQTLNANCVKSIKKDLEHCSSEVLKWEFVDFYRDYEGLQTVMEGFGKPPIGIGIGIGLGIGIGTGIEGKEGDLEETQETELKIIKHPLLIWTEQNAPQVQKMKEPLTSSECEKLLKDYPEEKIRDKLSAMHNKINLTKKYHSANLTVRNWLKMSNVAKLNSNGNDQLEGKTITLRRA
jgi:hypothetical protein